MGALLVPGRAIIWKLLCDLNPTLGDGEKKKRCLLSAIKKCYSTIVIAVDLATQNHLIGNMKNKNLCKKRNLCRDY